MTARPYAYIRKSTQGTAESMADQIANVQAIVARNGRPQDAHDLVMLTADWGLSGAREKRAKRLDLDRLIEAIRAGDVSHVYAYSHDRLARDVEVSATLLNAMADAGIEVTTGERTWRPRDPMDRQQWHFTAMQGEAYVEQAQRKARDRVVNQRRRGVQLGQPPYGDRPGEDWEAVVAAFLGTGTLHGAARLLIERGVKSRRGHLQTAQGVPMAWEASTVRRVLMRRRPDLIRPTDRGKGVRLVATHRISRLLVCPDDGSVMTTIPHKDGRAVSYACRIGHREAGHPRPWVISENVILPAVQAAVQLAGARVSFTSRSPEGVEGDLTDLQAKRERVIESYMEGLIGKAARDERLTQLDAEIGNLEAIKRTSWSAAGPVDWDASPGEINARLRELWTGIKLARRNLPARPADVPHRKGAGKAAGLVKGRHADVTSTLVPEGAYWRVVPVEATGERDEYGVGVERPMAGAERQPDGSWFVPFGSAES